MGIEGVKTNSKSGNMEKLSTPPGYVSQTTFVLKKVHGNRGSSRSLMPNMDSADAVMRFLTNRRAWIVHDHNSPNTEALKPKKSEVRAKRLPKVSETQVLEEAPIFNPTEEEFSDTLSYIASLRDRAEPYGICCVVPPPSWKPPCLLKEKRTSTFVTQVQLFDGKRTENPKIKKEADMVTFCRIERGLPRTLENFKGFADLQKISHFSIKDETLGSKNSSPSPKPKEPTTADIEKEYRQRIESPLVEFGVIYGNDVDTKTFGSGFPLSGTSDSCKYKTSGWNLNSTAKLPGSLLSFEDCESVCVPRLSVGTCFSSQFWKSEKARLYSLCYLHVGAPRIWYSVAECHRSEFKETMKNLIPETSGEQPKLSGDAVMVVSPFALSMEGIPVTRCVQNPGQYVIISPGSYYFAIDCGFNCLEKVNFAPIDWLPHGDIAAQQNQDKRIRSFISYDKLLFNAAREAVKCLKEYSLSKKTTAWSDSCGKDGLFTDIFKSRIEQEKSRRKFLCSSVKSQRIDESYDALSKRECCVCFGDLHLSAVRCSCSGDRYSCLLDMRKLCCCPLDRKSLLYRYTVEELDIFVEALEGKLSSMFIWGNIDRNYFASPASITTTSSSQPEDRGKATDEVMPWRKMRIDVDEAGSEDQTKPRMKARSIMEILNVKKGNDDGEGPVRPCSKKQKHG